MERLARQSQIEVNEPVAQVATHVTPESWARASMLPPPIAQVEAECRFQLAVEGFRSRLVNIILGILSEQGGRFCSALIDSTTAEQNTTPSPL
jgi:hypothetical protein